jgi:ribonuclease PH
LKFKGTAEGEPFTKDEMNNIIQFAEQGIAELIQIQKNVLK